MLGTNLRSRNRTAQKQTKTVLQYRNTVTVAKKKFNVTKNTHPSRRRVLFPLLHRKQSK